MRRMADFLSRMRDNAPDHRLEIPTTVNIVERSVIDTTFGRNTVDDFISGRLPVDFFEKFPRSIPKKPSFQCDMPK